MLQTTVNVLPLPVLFNGTICKISLIKKGSLWGAFFGLIVFDFLLVITGLDKGTPLIVHRLRHELLLKRVAFCVHIVWPCLVSVDIRIKSEYDKKKKESEHDSSLAGIVPEHDKEEKRART